MVAGGSEAEDQIGGKNNAVVGVPFEGIRYGACVTSLSRSANLAIAFGLLVLTVCSKEETQVFEKMASFSAGQHLQP